MATLMNEEIFCHCTPVSSSFMSIAIYDIFWSVSILEPFWSRVLGEKESDLEKAVSPLHGGETAALRVQDHVRGECIKVFFNL